MKKIVLLLIAILMLFTSCSFRKIEMYSTLFRSDQDVANESFDQVLYAIQTQDATMLKSLFSEKAIIDAEDFDENITALFDFFKGAVLSYDGWAGPATSARSDGEGHYQEKFQSTYDVKTTESIYRFAIREYVIDTKDLDVVGIYSLYIMNGENSDLNIAYWGGGEWAAGIHIETEKNVIVWDGTIEQ